VLAPDQRGYGPTTGWDAGYDCELGAYGALSLVRDAMGLVHALGIRSVAAVVGHDFGAMVAAWCALLRPDIFRSLVLMSAPFAGPPALPSPAALARSPQAPRCPRSSASIGNSSRSIRRASTTSGTTPRAPRTATCTATRRACTRSCAPISITRAPTGRRTARYRSLRGPRQNWPRCRPTTSCRAIGHGRDRRCRWQAAEIAACRWLTEEELGVYSAEYARTGFQGGLNWYRARSHARTAAEQQIFAGRTIDVPACFIAGKSDWGTYQRPGDLERMQRACTRMSSVELVEGAGHWVQQERPEAVSRLLVEFLRRAASEARPQAGRA
jgi:pimeloyl-ACP methyl ester carboxylesterase